MFSFLSFVKSLTAGQIVFSFIPVKNEMKTCMMYSILFQHIMFYFYLIYLYFHTAVAILILLYLYSGFYETVETRLDDFAYMKFIIEGGILHLAFWQI